MSKPQPEPKRVYVTIAFSFLWIIFIALWLIFFAASYSIIQNIGIIILSLAIVGIIMVILWVPWGLKNS
jgi:hypothetical protein